MHAEAFVEMDRLLNKWRGPTKVLDVGSYDVNGTLRPLAEKRKWAYVGVDIQPGPNVSVVMDSPHEIPFDDKSFDVVMTCSTLEHVEHPWLLVPEMARLLRGGGLLVIHTHANWPFHPYPKDYWRFMPHGIELLFDLAGCLEQYEIELTNQGKDISGVAWRKDQ